MTYKLILCLSYFITTVPRISIRDRTKPQLTKYLLLTFSITQFTWLQQHCFNYQNVVKISIFGILKYFNHHKFGKTILEPIMLSIYINVFKHQSNRKTLKNFVKVWKSLRKTWNDSSSLFHCVCTKVGANRGMIRGSSHLH